MMGRALGRTGMQVSRLSFGAASLGEEYGPIDPAAALRVVPHAIERGITFFDTSPYYGRGRSEVMLGHALRGIPRERYRIGTKIGRYDDRVFDFSARRVTESVHVSMKRLGVDHLDVVLCHDIEFVDLQVVVEEAIPRLRELQQEGKVGAVGVSAYPVPALRRLVDRCPLDVVLSYGNLVLHNRRLTGLLPDLASRGIGVIDAAPFDMGLLTDALPPPWHPAPQDLRAAVDTARALCRTRGFCLAKLAFQFALSHDGPATTVVGTASPDEIDAWLHWLEEPPDHELLRAVETLLAPVRDRARVVGLPENN